MGEADLEAMTATDCPCGAIEGAYCQATVYYYILHDYSAPIFSVEESVQCPSSASNGRVCSHVRMNISYRLLAFAKRRGGLLPTGSSAHHGALYWGKEEWRYWTVASRQPRTVRGSSISTAFMQAGTAEHERVSVTTVLLPIWR